ncbi:hypothetical protein HZA40_01190, partial [Candidatus Peregrinibacteria bacterium]|nr:hypothetical protein [Candidatus Peregrinibacteria bacterium]
VNQSDDSVVDHSRRKFLGLVAGALGVAVVGLGLSKFRSSADKPPEKAKVPVTPVTKDKESEKQPDPKRAEQLKAAAEDIESFLAAIDAKEELKGNVLYDSYTKALKDKKRKDDGVLQMDIFRKVLADYVTDKITLTKEEKAIFEDNKYFASRCVGLAHMTCNGKNIAGGKVQINSKGSIAKRYKKFKEDTEMGQAMMASKKLQQYVDPDLLFALIRNETDFVNFYNRAEGVSGEFQFTSMQPPAEDTFELPKNIEAELNRLKNTKDGREYGRYVTLLRKKRYNEMYANLDDVSDNNVRKQLAMGLAFIYGNRDAVVANFSGNENIRKNQAWLMAIAFYNSDIARINPNLDKGSDPNTRIANGSVSAFMETLPFYNASGAGKLYVPRFIVGYDLFKALEENEDPDDVEEGHLYARILSGAMQPNFGLPFKG